MASEHVRGNESEPDRPVSVIEEILRFLLCAKVKYLWNCERKRFNELVYAIALQLRIRRCRARAQDMYNKYNSPSSKQT